MDSNTINTLHFGVLGEKLGHSLSPEIQDDLFKQQHISATYKKYELTHEELPHVFELMKSEQLTGMNVTIPYKENIYQMVDVLDEHAKEIGAVNTIYLKDGVTYGYNTDYIGVTSMLKKAGFDLKGKDVVILGSGGASRALIYGFHLHGAASITIAARNQAAEEILTEQFPYLKTCSFDEISGGDLIINTTPVGMYPNVGKSPVGANIIRKFKVASDIVYNPLITEFLHIAQQEGLQTVTGLMMLVDQAIGSQEIWLNKKLDYNMGNRIHDELAKQFL